MTNTSNARLMSTPLSWNILDIVGQFSDHQCGDGHDRIFALLGLASDVAPTSQKEEHHPRIERLYMNVDYLVSIKKSYIDFPIACMERGVGMVPRLSDAALARLHGQSSED